MKVTVCEANCHCGSRCELYAGHEDRPDRTGHAKMTHHTCKSCLERQRTRPNVSTKELAREFKFMGMM